MDLREQFWEAIQQDMLRDFGNGYPRDWQKPEIEAFCFWMNTRLKEICSRDDRKARLCNVPTFKGDFEYHRMKPLSYDAFRKIFKVKESKGGKLTRNQFAICFGADSYEDYLLRNDIKALLVSPSAQQEESPSPKKPTFIFSAWHATGILLLLAGSLYLMSRTHEMSQFMLVRNEDGIVTIDQLTKQSKQLITHDYITGLEYDPLNQLLFWSKFGGCPYCGVSKAQVKQDFSAIVPGTMELFFTEKTNQPCGIALDPERRIFYLANYGAGIISKYDYAGKLLDSSLVKGVEMKPSSIELDIRRQVLYWTDILHNRIGRIFLNTSQVEADFLTQVGQRPDGLSLDTAEEWLFWASSESHEIGRVDLNTNEVTLSKIPRKPSAVEYDAITATLYIAIENGNSIYQGVFQGNTLILKNNIEDIIDVGKTRPGIMRIIPGRK